MDIFLGCKDLSIWKFGPLSYFGLDFGSQVKKASHYWV
jgi:hypothetical protein